MEVRSALSAGCTASPPTAVLAATVGDADSSCGGDADNESSAEDADGAPEGDGVRRSGGGGDDANESFVAALASNTDPNADVNGGAVDEPREVGADRADGPAAPRGLGPGLARAMGGRDSEEAATAAVVDGSLLPPAVPSSPFVGLRFCDAPRAGLAEAIVGDRCDGERDVKGEAHEAGEDEGSAPGALVVHPPSLRSAPVHASAASVWNGVAWADSPGWQEDEAFRSAPPATVAPDFSLVETSFVTTDGRLLRTQGTRCRAGAFVLAPKTAEEAEAAALLFPLPPLLAFRFTDAAFAWDRGDATCLEEGSSPLAFSPSSSSS